MRWVLVRWLLRLERHFPGLSAVIWMIVLTIAAYIDYRRRKRRLRAW